MIRQFSRLILLCLVAIKNFVFRYPGASIGFLAGGLAGFLLGSVMVRFGFPEWALPVMWAVAVAPVVKKYMDGLR